MRTTLLFLLQFTIFNCFSQQITGHNNKNYNTVCYYPYFDYRCNDTTKNNYVKGVGNTEDSLKTGTWTYYTSDGKILAKGKYRNGYKRGRWEYKSGQVVLMWDRSAWAKDHIGFDFESKQPQIIDIVDTKFTSYKVINGYTIRQAMPIRFL